MRRSRRGWILYTIDMGSEGSRYGYCTDYLQRQPLIFSGTRAGQNNHQPTEAPSAEGVGGLRRHRPLNFTYKVAKFSAAMSAASMNDNACKAFSHRLVFYFLLECGCCLILVTISVVCFDTVFIDLKQERISLLRRLFVLLE